VKVAGLFSGIGGIERGLERAGHEATLLCEIDTAAKAVLAMRFPDVRIDSDVRDLRRLPKNVDLVTAGFPCQDLSQAGKTKGIFGSNSGLIRHVFRLLEESSPPWVLIENVPFLLRLQSGRGMTYLVQSLERLGYRWAYRVVNTIAFGLPQRRERVFLLASNVADPSQYLFAHDEPPARRLHSGTARGFYWTEGTKGLGWAVDSIPTLKGGSALGIPSAPAIWFPDGRFATPDIRDAERLQGFPADWTKPAEALGRRSYRWTLVGNAVPVPAARWIGRILSSGPTTHDHDAMELKKGDPWPNAAFGGLGRARFAVEAGKWPVASTQRHLHEFLRFDARPLSLRAVEGFRARLLKSSLYRPAKFDLALEKYIRRIAGAQA
jgi:DNA (cytosine-5)-methyltransferase 1